MQKCIFACVVLAVLTGKADAQTISFVCEWQDSQPKYLAEFEVDPSTNTAKRKEPLLEYDVILLSAGCVWMKVRDVSFGANAVITTIERSSVGGRWSEVWVPIKGQPSHIDGGYCVEKPQ